MKKVRRPVPGLALAIVALTANSSSAGAADEEVARTATPTPIAAYGGWLAWSARDAGTGTFRLVLRAPDGTLTQPAIAPRSVPFDVDLGPDTDGGVLAAYSRCRTEPTLQFNYPTQPNYVTGRRCAPYLLDIARNSERRVRTADAASASEVWPSPWKGRLAFARAYNDSRGLALYVGRYDRPSRSARQPGGPRRECFRDARTGREWCSPGGWAAYGLELHGRRLAFAWSFQGTGEGVNTQIRLDTLGGGSELVAGQHGGGLSQVELGWPAFHGGWLSWSRECWGDPGGCPHRYGLERRRVSGGSVQRVAGPRIVLAHDGDGAATYVLTPSESCGTGGDAVSGCPLQRLTARFRSR